MCLHCRVYSHHTLPKTETCLNGKPSDDGSTRSHGKTGERSPSEPPPLAKRTTSRTDGAGTVSQDGREPAPRLTGPLVIFGLGSKFEPIELHSLCSGLSKKEGSDEHICTLYLGQREVASLASICGGPGSTDMVGVRFGLSIPKREQPSTSQNT